MKKTTLIISPMLLKCLMLWSFGVEVAVSQVTSTQPTGLKKTTPDPYFNPKLQPLADSTQPSTSLLQPIVAIANPLVSSADWGGSSITSQSPLPPTIENWEIPRTPSSPLVRNNTPSIKNSIIRQHGGGLATSAGAVQLQPDKSTDGFATAKKPSAQLDDAFDPPHQPTTTIHTGITPNSGGNFSADLSNLKKPVPASSATRPASPALDPVANLPESTPTKSAKLASDNNFAPADKTADSPPSNLPRTMDKKNSSPVDASPLVKIPTPESVPFEPTKLVAMVGNEPIFVGDMLFEVNQLVEKFMPTAPQSIKNEEIKKIIPKLVPKYVDAKLLYIGTLRKLPAEADVNKILEQAGKEFDENAMGKMMESAGLKTSAEFDAQLRAQGSSLRKLRLSWSQDQLTKYFLSQQLAVDTEVTHQAMLDDYQKRIAEYSVPARARWEQVMIRFDRTESRSEAEKLLVEMGNQIVYGANFASVAKKGSHGFNAAGGGQHDWTSQGSLVLTQLDQAIFSLPIGELSEKIETTDGFHVVRVLERTDATHKPFLEAQVEIKQRMLDEKRNAAFEKHLKKLRQEIQVEYFLGSAPPSSS